MEYLLNLNTTLSAIKELVDLYRRIFPDRKVALLSDKEISRLLCEIVKEKAPPELKKIDNSYGSGYMYNEEGLMLVESILDGTVTVKDIVDSVSESPDYLTGLEIYPTMYEGDDCPYTAEDYWQRKMNNSEAEIDAEDEDGYLSDPEEYDYLFTDDKTTVLNLVANETSDSIIGMMPLGPLLALTLNPYIYFGSGLSKEIVQENPLACLIETMFDIVDTEEFGVDNNPFLGEYERNSQSGYSSFFGWEEMDKLKEIIVFSGNVWNNIPDPDLVNSPHWLISHTLQAFWLAPEVRKKIEENNKNGHTRN